MRKIGIFWTALALSIAWSAGSVAADCENPKTAIGVSRTMTIDTSIGGVYGTFKKQGTELLNEGEFVLTFDDGPHPKLTAKILKTLDEHCTKATFFAVGQMARMHSDALKAVADAGHTVGGHTWKHINIQKTPFEKSVKDVERGFAAVSLATQGRVAPFFRFPRLRPTKAMLGYLKERQMSVFSVDVISGDTEYFRSDVLIKRTLRYMRQKKKGIVLFHDLKKATARALPKILATMKKRGYKIVHVVPKHPLDIDNLIVSNLKLQPKTKKPLDKNISLASSKELKAYFGPVAKPKFKKFKKTKPKKKKKKGLFDEFEDNDLSDFWAFD